MKEAKIVLIDDSDEDSELTIRALSTCFPYADILRFEDGASGLEHIQLLNNEENEDKHLPVLFILDVKMPKILGFDVLKQLRNTPATRYIPVVIFSSSKMEADVLTAHRLGANSYVVKPIDFDDYQAVVSQVGNYWLKVNTSVTYEFSREDTFT